MRLEINWSLDLDFGRLIDTLHDYVWPGEDEEDE